jgi:hypothetical protein
VTWDRTPPGFRQIPRDVGTFARLQDYRDANEYLILLIPYDPDDCTCGWACKEAAHGDSCPATSDGGSWDRWTRFTGAVATEVSRLLAGEAAAIHAGKRQATMLEEVADLRAATVAAAEATGLPARFTVEQQSGQPYLIYPRPGEWPPCSCAPVRLRGGAGFARRAVPQRRGRQR